MTNAIERLIDAARAWQDAHAYVPPPETPPPQGWLNLRMEQRRKTADALRAAINALPSDPGGVRLADWRCTWQPSGFCDDPVCGDLGARCKEAAKEFAEMLATENLGDPGGER